MKSVFAACYVSTYPYGDNLNNYIHQHTLSIFLFLFFNGPYQREMYFTSVLPTSCQVLTRAESSAWKEISHDRKPSSLLVFYSFKSERLFKCNLRGNAQGQLRRHKNGDFQQRKGFKILLCTGRVGLMPHLLFPLLEKKRKCVVRCGAASKTPSKSFLIRRLPKRQDLFYEIEFSNSK